jgi:hypothetical protein
MAWADSRVFTAAVFNPLTQHVNPGSITSPTGYSDIVATDAILVALFNNTGTPDRTVAVASTGFNTGQWTTASNEVTGTNWATGGQTLGTKAYANVGGTSVAFTAANVSVSTATISGAFGDMVYDNSITAGTVAKQGLCYNYFGGSQSVTAGTFTIQWNAAGVFNFAT